MRAQVKFKQLLSLLVLILAVCVVSTLGAHAETGEINLSVLIQESMKIEDEMDHLIQLSKKNPLDRLHKGPMAPKPTSAEERAQLRRIAHYGGSAQSPLMNEPLSAQTPSLMEQSSQVSMDLKNTIEATLVSNLKAHRDLETLNLMEIQSQTKQPNLNLPPPGDAEYYAARARWNSTVPTDIENRLRKLWPKPVNLDPNGPLIADEYMNADEILPKDPTADSMLHHFNLKYGVFDDNGIPSKLPAPPDSELLPANTQNYTDVERDYSSVYDHANKFGFDMEKDSIASLDQMLASMWRKRWEYFATEKQTAEARIAKQKEEATKDLSERTFPIDVLFPQRQLNPDQTGESLLGNVYTFSPNAGTEDEKPPLPYIPNRAEFKPETSFYGPSVTDQALDIVSHVPNPAKTDYFQPDYSDPYAPMPSTIKLIKSEPSTATDPTREMVDPFVKGDGFNPLLATPAKLVRPSELPKQKK